MRVSIIVGPDGVERVVSVGPGLQSTRESVTFFSTIWSEVQDFHRAVVRKLKSADKVKGGAEHQSPHKAPSSQP